MVCAVLLAACWFLSRMAGLEFGSICDEVTNAQTRQALCFAIAP